MNLDKLSMSDLTELRNELHKQTQIRLAFLIDGKELPISKMLIDVETAIGRKIKEIFTPQ